jgi:hypothetical protein
MHPRSANYHCDARKALIGYGRSYSSIDNRIAPNYRPKGGEVYPSDSLKQANASPFFKHILTVRGESENEKAYVPDQPRADR